MRAVVFRMTFDTFYNINAAAPNMVYFNCTLWKYKKNTKTVADSEVVATVRA